MASENPPHQEAIVAVCAWCDDYARGFYEHRWRPTPPALIREAKRLGLTTDGICGRCRARLLPGSAAHRPCCGSHVGLAALLEAGAPAEGGMGDASVTASGALP